MQSPTFLTPKKSQFLLKITPEAKRALGFQSDSMAAVSYSQNVPAKQEIQVSCHHLVTERGQRGHAAGGRTKVTSETPRARSVRRDRGLRLGGGRVVV